MDRNDIADITPTVTLAKLYEAQGLLKKAATVYRRLLSREPNCAELEKALKEIERRLEGQRIEPGKSEAKAILYRLRQWQEVIHSRKIGVDQWHEKERKILVIHGPNLDTFGLRETPLSDDVTLEQIDGDIRNTAEACGICVDIFQSNDEEKLVQKICEASDCCDVLIINPGEYTHTSTPIRDALSKLEIPIIEVHPSNVFSLDPSRQESLIADVVTAHLAGFGKEGYVMALRAAAKMAGEAMGAGHRA